MSFICLCLANLFYGLNIVIILGLSSKLGPKFENDSIDVVLLDGVEEELLQCLLLLLVPKQTDVILTAPSKI